MTIGEKMTITTWRARQLAYLEEMYAPREHMGKLMSHLGARHVYIQLYAQMHAALESLPEQPNSYVAMAVYRKLREDMSTLDDMLDQLEDTGLHDPDEYDPTGWRCDAMSLTPIGYVVQIRVADVLCLYFTRLSQGGIDLTADLDKAMLFDTEERARDFALHAGYVLRVDEQHFVVEACFEEVTLNGDADLLDADDAPDDDNDDE